MRSYITKDGVEVIVADGVSHSHREDLNEEVISKIVVGDQPFVRETISLGRTIGKNHLVERKPGDELYRYARNGRSHGSVFALNREGEDTDKATVVIAKGGPEDGELDGKLVLVTLYEGDPGMPEPYGRNDNEECRKFWDTHALVPTARERLEMLRELKRDDIARIEYSQVLFETAVKAHQHWRCRDCPGRATMRADFSGMDLRGIVIRDMDLEGAVFHGADLSGATIENSTFRKADLTGAKLSSSTIEDATFDEADMRGVHMNNIRTEGTVTFISANMSNAVIKDSSMERGYFSGVKMPDAVLINTTLDGSSFWEADLRGISSFQTSMKNTGMEDADLTASSLEEVCLSSSRMKNVQFNESTWKKVNCEGADLTGAVALNAKIEYSQFQDAILKGVRFDGSVLYHSNFSGSDIRKSDLNNVHTQGSSFKGVNLSKSFLTASHAEETDFSESILAGTNFYNCGLYGSSMENAAFSGNGFWHLGSRPAEMPLKLAVLFVPTTELEADTPSDVFIQTGMGTAIRNEKKEPLDKGLILVSDIRLDTVGGIMALQGIKPEDAGFWKAAEFIGMNGMHHIHEFPQDVQDKLNAYYAHEQALLEAEGPLPKDKVSNITQVVQDRMHAIDIILDTRHPEHAQYIREGAAWEKEMSETIEAQHVFDTENVRVFITEGPSTAASFYSPETGEIMPATVTMDLNTTTITVAFEDGGKDGKSAKELIQELWGWDEDEKPWDPEAGGTDGIATSHEDELMTPDDLVRAVMQVEETLQPAASMERLKDLNSMSDMLREAVKDNITERELKTPPFWEMDESINR